MPHESIPGAAPTVLTTGNRNDTKNCRDSIDAHRKVGRRIDQVVERQQRHKLLRTTHVVMQRSSCTTVVFNGSSRRPPSERVNASSIS